MANIIKTLAQAIFGETASAGIATPGAGQAVVGVDATTKKLYSKDDEGNVTNYGEGGGGVESVDGDGVDNTDPNNPVISYPAPADIGAVATTGNETVAGVKTFSSSPIVPTPTTDMQAATKQYVDNNAGGGAYPVFTRVSCVSGEPYSATEYTAQTSLYVMPLGGNTYPQWDGTTFAATEFAEKTMTLNSSYQLASTVYDLYIFEDSGTVYVGCGVAWTSATSRGTGAGTAEIELVNGVRVNKNSMTIRNGASSWTIAARYATLVATNYPSANGQIDESNNWRSIYNFYNQKTKFVKTKNTTASWAYSTHTAREWNNGTGQVKGRFVLGEAQVAIPALTSFAVCASGRFVDMALVYDSTNFTNALAVVEAGQYSANPSQPVGLGIFIAAGGHYLTLVEDAVSSASVTVYGVLSPYELGGSIYYEG